MLLLSLTLLIVIVIVGAVAFTLFEPSVHGDIGTALWLTLVTVMTVGYGDIVPISDAGRIIASLVMISGIGAGIYTLTLIFQLVVTDKLRVELGLPPRRTHMKEHYIVCGYGMVGHQVVHQLQCKNEKFIVIENDRDKVEVLVERGIEVLHGDAEDEGTLVKANIASAKGFITTMKDSQNLVAIIAAKTLSPKLYVVSEVEEEKNIAKLRRVGADVTINCHEMGARIMVDNARQAMVDPVCQVELSGLKGEFKLEHDGRVISFCSQECLEAFRKHPDRFRQSGQDGEICAVPVK